MVDFNIDFGHPNKRDCKLLRDVMNDYGLQQLIEDNTHITERSRSKILDQVCSYKYLGLILDEHLTYNKHIKEMNKVVSHKLYLMSKIRKYLTEQACIDIFKTMVLSVIEYCDIIYGGTSQGNLSTIDKLFYRGLRICQINNETKTKTELCQSCRVAPLKDRNLSRLLLFMYKQKENIQLLKKPEIRTRLHTAPVFYTYKPNNEKARANVFNRGAIMEQAYCGK